MHKITGLFAIVKISILSLILISSSNAWGKVYDPSPTQIVASWDNQQSLATSRASLQNVARHLHLAQFPGVSNLHLRQAEQMLNQLKNQQQDKADFWYYQARVLEHQHQFSQAIVALDKALARDKSHVSAWLMKSNVQLITGQPKQAKASCAQLVGITNVDLVLVCSLQTAASKQQLAAAYQRLKPIAAKLAASSLQPTESDLWVMQVTADMACQLGLWQEAQQWLTLPLEQAPISYLSLWADIQLELNQPQHVLAQLGPIVTQAGFADDALLMRLAMAEQVKNQHNPQLPLLNSWTLAATKRAKLRLVRQDFFHAADLTRYFLYIQPDQQKALHWAEQNIQQSQNAEDYRLLAAAKNISKDS